MGIIIPAKCTSCSTRFSDIFVERDSSGKPTLVGHVCTNCNQKDSLIRDWESVTMPSSPIVENGELQRFEYSYRDPSGKLVNGKMSPAQINHHLTNAPRNSQRK